MGSSHKPVYHLFNLMKTNIEVSVKMCSPPDKNTILELDNELFLVKLKLFV